MTTGDILAPEADLTQVWLTDRSRIEEGWSHCPRKRYLSYHAGPAGYGISRRAASLPLVTGTYSHDLLAELIQEEQMFTRRAPALLIEKHIKRYRNACAQRGFADGVGQGLEGELERVISEQAALIESFGWAAHYYWLPQLFAEYEVVMVEEEILRPLPAEGVGMLMIRPDLALRRKSDGTLVQVDFKTAADTSYIAWRRQWEDNFQLAIQGWGLGEHLGEEVDFAYIYALIKGRRSREKSKAAKEAAAAAGGDTLEKQWSPFLYAYHHPGNPPMEPPAWAMHYEWTDEQGAPRRLGKGYARETIRDYKGFPQQPAGMSNQEYWVRSMGEEEAGAQREVLGPFQTGAAMRGAVVKAVAGEEMRWQEKLWQLHDARAAAGGDERDPRYLEALDREVPQTWACHRYGQDCAMLKICQPGRTVGEALESGEYQLRRPHHTPEIDQMRQRGIEPPAAESGEESED